MEYVDFYDIAVYGNEHWKGSFTPREVADNAYCYKVCYDVSKEDTYMDSTIIELLKLLDEDGGEECREWSEEIRYGLKHCKEVSYAN